MSLWICLWIGPAKNCLSTHFSKTKIYPQAYQGVQAFKVKLTKYWMFQTARGVSNLYGFLERCFPTLRLVKHKNPVKATKLWKPSMNPGEAVKEATTNKYYSLDFFRRTVELSNCPMICISNHVHVFSIRKFWSQYLIYFFLCRSFVQVTMKKAWIC